MHLWRGTTVRGSVGRGTSESDRSEVELWLPLGFTEAIDVTCFTLSSSDPYKQGEKHKTL